MVGRRRLFTDQQLIELHEQGFNDREIGKNLFADQTTVGEHRRRLGLKAHDPRRLFTDQQLIELYEQGFNDTEMGEKLGAGKSTVRDRRIRLGLKPIRKLGLKAARRTRS